MNDVLWLYLFTRLDAFHCLMFGAILFCAVGGAAYGSFRFCGISDCYPLEESTAWEKYRKNLIRVTTVIAVLAVLKALVPTTADVAIIVGGKIALDVGRSDEAREVGQEVVDAIRAQLRKAAEK